MYYIRKYTDCWAVHDDVTGASRKLTENEKAKISIEFPSLQDERVLTVYADRLRSIQVIKDYYETNQNPPGP